LRISTLNFAEIGANVFGISIFQMAIRHYIEFLKGHNFIWRGGLEDWETSPCQILSKLVQHSRVYSIFYFSTWPLQPSWFFKFVKFYWLKGSRWPRHTIVPNFVKIGQSLAFDFSFFQDDGCLPSWICLGHVWTTHEEYSVVSITVQNLVTINAVVLIIWTFQYLAQLAGKSLFMPKELGFWDYLTPQMPCIIN